MTIVRIIATIGLVVSGISVTGQSIDSLKRLLEDAEQPSERISLLRQLGDAFMATRDTSALQYFEELIALSESSGDPLLKPYAYYRMGVCWYNQNNIQRSTDLYFKGLEASKDSKEFNEIKAKLYNAIGWNFNLMERDDAALKYLKKAEIFAKPLNNAQLLGLIVNNKGVVYRHFGKFDSALVYFQQSLAINREINNQRQVRFNLNNIGNALFDLKRFTEAKAYINEALLLNLESQDTVEIVNNRFNLGVISLEEKKFEEAKELLNNALILAIANKSLDQQRRIYSTLTDLSRQTNNFKDAFQYQNEFYRLTDSLYRKETTAKILETEARYNSLQKENDLQEAKRKVVEQRFYLSVIVGVLLITLVIIFFMWRLIKLKRANEKLLLNLNNEIQTQAEELRQANEEISVTNENLEQLVKNRTEIIRLQNERLIQFAFMNSHKIRAPLATLIGLVNLLEDGKSAELNLEILTHLKTTTIRMDEIIGEVNRELEKEDRIKQ